MNFNCLKAALPLESNVAIPLSLIGICCQVLEVEFISKYSTVNCSNFKLVSSFTKASFLHNSMLVKKKNEEY